MARPNFLTTAVAAASSPGNFQSRLAVLVDLGVSGDVAIAAFAHVQGSSTPVVTKVSIGGTLTGGTTYANTAGQQVNKGGTVTGGVNLTLTAEVDPFLGIPGSGVGAAGGPIALTGPQWLYMECDSDLGKPTLSAVVYSAAASVGVGTNFAQNSLTPSQGVATTVDDLAVIVGYISCTDSYTIVMDGDTVQRVRGLQVDAQGLNSVVWDEVGVAGTTTLAATLSGGSTPVVGGTKWAIRGLTVVPPAITDQPDAQTVDQPNTATFAGAFSGTATSVQWKRKPGGTGAAVNVVAGTGATTLGAGTVSYTTAATSLSGGNHNNGDTYGFVLQPGDIESTYAPLTVNNVAVLSSPQAINVGANTATLRFSTNVLSGTAYFLRRTGLTPASAATIIASGESQAISGSNPQSRNMVGFTVGETYYVDMAQSGSTSVVSAGPFYPGSGRPVSDISVVGWSGSAGGLLSALLDENTSDEIDFITSPELSASPVVAVFGLDKTYTPGTWPVSITVATSSGSGTMQISLLNDSDTVVGSSAPTAISSTPTTYELPVTITGNATRIQVSITQP